MEDVLKISFTDEVKESLEKLKVLILEDKQSDAELVKLHFEELGYTPEYKVTETRVKYLEYLEQFKPDIIISDFNLPNFDGLKALSILRNKIKDDITPFVFVTGTLGEENAVKAIKGGATDFILKERMQQLPAAILKALREKREKLNKNEATKREQLKDRRFKRLVQEGLDLIIITDYRGRIQFSSDNYMRILGYSSDEMVGANPFRFIHPDDLQNVKTSFEKIKKENIIKIEPYRFLDANKNWRWLQSMATNLYSDESIAGIVVNSNEVTEIIEREQELKLSKEKYHFACIATQDLIYDWDLKKGSVNRDGKVLYQMFGYDPTHAQDEQFWNEKIHPEDTVRFFENLRKSLQDPNKTIFEQNYRFRRNDDLYAFLHDKGYILRDTDGIATRVIGAIQDISEQYEKEHIKDLKISISKQLSMPSSLSECMNRILKTLVEELDVNYAELWLPTKHNGHLNLVSCYADSSQVEVMSGTKIQIPKNKGLAGKVFNEGIATFWTDIKKKPEFINKQFAKKANLESVLGIPIKKGDQTIGTFLFYAREKQFNFKRNIDVLQEISNWLSPEIQHKQASEELDKFFSTSVDLLCILGTDGFLKKTNPAFITTLGYSEIEFLRNPLKNFVHPDDYQFTKSQIVRLDQGEKSIHFENRLVSKDGLVKWFSWSATIQPNEGEVFAIGKEISEKKRLEEFIQDTQTMAKVGSWEVNLKNNNSYWTPQTYDILELDQGHQPSLDTSLDFFKDENRDIIEKCVNEGIESGKPWDVELKVSTAKGNEKWVRSMGKVEVNGGKPIRLYGVFQDIEEQKKREEALKISYKRFELASRATREAIYEWDFQTNDLHWTENYLLLFGYNDFKESFDDWRLKIHPLDQNRVIDSIDVLLEKSDQHFWKCEYRFITKDNKVAFVEERGYLERDKNGRPVAMIGSVQDLTEKKMFHEQLLENTIQAQEKERNRIAQELHDGIVQEMVVCSMHSDLLRKSANGIKELEEKINELTNYIKQVTNSTRDISHNLLSANVQEMTLFELLDRLDLRLRLNSEVNFNIENFLDQELIFDDEVKINLYRVIQELSNNIIKHSGATNAMIILERIGNNIIVTVSDNGMGIKETSQSGGIGLSNVADRITLIGGKISFQNGSNGGLEISIEVPID